MSGEPLPGRLVTATAPVRVADVGGWTDTWFGSPGRVCHLAVGPGVTAEVAVGGPVRGSTAEADRWPVVVDLASIGTAPYGIGPGSSGWSTPTTGGHPLIEHAIGAALERTAPPEGLSTWVTVTSNVPAGASLGTSAAVVVAVIAALDAAIGGGTLLPEEIARLAHQVETERAGRQSGVQDQWAAAVGGCGLLAVGPYPDVRHEPIAVPDRALADLRHRLVTVVFGPHDSSLVHGEVINAMVGCSGVEHDRARGALRRLSMLAGDAAAALADGAVDQWGEVLVASTEAQRELHAGLVGPAHQAAIAIAQQHGSVGWKVNGAGGVGGSLTVLASPDRAGALRTALAAAGSGWQVVDLEPVRGGVAVG
ncbi:MAG: mevalonate kinase [Ilumatobacteraceae bacterium]|nr:mevalonate kinase [Ilumatobacteraceae bacterium]